MRWRPTVEVVCSSSAELRIKVIEIGFTGVIFQILTVQMFNVIFVNRKVC